MMVNLPCLKGSCPNFLRPTCSYTECQLSFQTGSCPTERTTASYSSCLHLILLTSLIFKDLIFSGRYTLLLAVGLLSAVVLETLHRYRVSFQNPARFQNHPEPSRGLDFHYIFLVFIMLPPIPVCSGVLCPLTSFSDHIPFPWPGS
jgi:hypothetical protein